MKKEQKYGFSENLNKQVEDIIFDWLHSANRVSTEELAIKILAHCEAEMVEPGAIIRAIDKECQNQRKDIGELILKISNKPNQLIDKIDELKDYAHSLIS